MTEKVFIIKRKIKIKKKMESFTEKNLRIFQHTNITNSVCIYTVSNKKIEPAKYLEKYIVDRKVKEIHI